MRRAAVALALVAMVSALSTGCGGGNSSSGKLKVAASIFPLYDFVRDVGGDLVEVELMIPSGADPHTFEPTASAMKFLSDADVFVTNGLGLEHWATDVLSKVGNPEAVTVEAGGSIPPDRLIATRDEELLEDKASAFVPDPHVWLDPTLAAYEVGAIRDGLVEADPEHSETYKANAAACLEKLEALDAELKARLAPVAGAAFAAAHPSWVYFAPRYGLVQAGNLEELPGREPSLKQIRELVNAARKLGVKAVVAEPQLSPRAVEELAAEVGPDVKVATIDSLGNPDDPEVDSYVKVMRVAGRSFAEALK